MLKLLIDYLRFILCSIVGLYKRYFLTVDPHYPQAGLRNPQTDNRGSWHTAIHSATSLESWNTAVLVFLLLFLSLFPIAVVQLIAVSSLLRHVPQTALLPETST